MFVNMLNIGILYNDIEMINNTCVYLLSNITFMNITDFL